MVALAQELIGAPSMQYRSREQGMSPQQGFDCSGFVTYLMHHANEACGTMLTPPRHANAQFREFGETVHYRQRKAGDLVYFPSRRKADLLIIGHVGLVVSREAYIHSPGKDGMAVELAALPDEPEELADVLPEDLYTTSPAGIKRLSLPITDGRWHAR